MTRTMILEIPLERLTTTPFDLGLYASPLRFRFLDCRSFIENKLLRIFEFDSLPSHQYSAISYPWLGLQVSNLPPGERLVVEGAKAADPIALSVLASACKASLSFDSEMMWLDRLSILQTSKADKRWQIQNMHTVYRDCAVCLVIPGGLMKLASVSDETTWIERGWTLQEAFVPVYVYVLFQWDKGNEHISAPIFASITEIESEHSAVVQLSRLLSASYSGSFRIGTDASGGIISGMSNDPNDRYEWVTVNCFESSHAAVLKSMMPDNTWRRELPAESRPTRERLHSAELSGIWRSSFMRTSSRPVDMVFSIMGIFGVTLDTSKFHEDDRIGATIALMQEATRNGHGADWLSISKLLPPCPRISTMPMFPTTTAAGQSVIQDGQVLVRVSDLVKDDVKWYIRRAPSGYVDDSGAFRFSAKSVAIAEYRTQGPRAKILKLDEEGCAKLPRDFDIWEGRPQDAQYYAIHLGHRGHNNRIVSNDGALAYDSSVVMLVERYSSEPEMFQRIGTGFVTPASVINDWVEREFVVGGQGL